MIDVYTIKMNPALDGAHFEKLMEFLSEEKQQQIYRFRRKEDAQRAIASEALIRHIIIGMLPIRNKDIVLMKNEYGKPYLRDYPNLQFNVSHSGEWVVCAVNHLQVGIDVEHIQPIDMKIAKRFFSNEEYCDLMDKDPAEQLVYFYDLWTLKESYIKALGKGLSIPLDSFSLKIEDNRISLKTVCWPMDCFFTQYDIDQRYKMSVCGREDSFCSKVVEKRPGEILDDLIINSSTF